MNKFTAVFALLAVTVGATKQLTANGLEIPASQAVYQLAQDEPEHEEKELSVEEYVKQMDEEERQNGLPVREGEEQGAHGDDGHSHSESEDEEEEAHHHHEDHHEKDATSHEK